MVEDGSGSTSRDKLSAHQIPAPIAAEILSIAQDSVFVTNNDLNAPRILYVNPAFTLLTGYAATNVIGKSPDLLRGPEQDLAAIAKLRVGESLSGEVMFRKSDGSPICVRRDIAPVRRQGVVAYFVTVLRDINLESDVGRAHTLAQAHVIDQLEDGILVIGRDGTVLFVNESTCRILGVDRHIGESCSELLDTLSEFELPSMTFLVRRLLRESRCKLEVQFRRGQSEGTLSIQLSVLTNESARFDGCVVTIRDLTERKRLDSIAASLNLHENAAFLFSGIRHELGNPVNSVKAALTVLQANIENYSAKKVDDYFCRVLKEIERIEYLLASLRSYNQFEKPRNQKVDIAELLRCMHSLLQRDCEFHGVDLQMVCEQGIYAMVDPRALDQVLINLVTNATNAMEGTGGVVALLARLVGSRVEIAVSDTGPGIAEENQTRIFEPFFTTKAAGTGMGLVIVRNLVSSMGGSIFLDDSRNSQGATFRIHLTGANS